LNNFGLLKNPYFRKLWEKNTAEEQRKWESLHRKQPYIPTGRSMDVMKLRLANFLDIKMPVNESGDESNDDDDPSIPTTVGGFTLDSIPKTHRKGVGTSSPVKVNIMCRSDCVLGFVFE
jgi:hypothetical protein